MKSEKGVTLTAIMVYVIAFTVAVIAVGRITNYFYQNMNNITSDTAIYAQVTKFNSYITDEINIENNYVTEAKTEYNESNEIIESYIIFNKSEIQYTFKNGKIYRNKAKICNNIEKCEFQYDDVAEIITVKLTISGQEFNQTYTIVK